MKFCVEQVARVGYADITLNGVTVIAGYNGTGKSTISKSLYALMDAFSGLADKVRAEKVRSAARFLFTWEPTQKGADRWERELEDCQRAAKRLVEEPRGVTEAVFEEILRQELPKSVIGDNEYQRITSILSRDSSEYERFIVERSFRAVFRDQINPLHTAVPAVFTLEEGESKVHLSFRDNELTELTRTPFLGRKTVYIGTLNILDVIAREAENFTYVDRLEEQLFKESQEEQPTFEEYRQIRENTEIVRGILRSITAGRIVKEGKKMRFLDDQLSENIDFSNLASGLKTFVIIQTLIENGTLTNGSILIVDEPEVNLHPEWQLKFAEILVLLHEKLGITMLLNTHSPYFLRAIEIYLAECGVAQHGNYYFTEERGDGFACTDVTAEPEVIYRALYQPLEQL